MAVRKGKTIMREIDQIAPQPTTPGILSLPGFLKGARNHRALQIPVMYVTDRTDYPLVDEDSIGKTAEELQELVKPTKRKMINLHDKIAYLGSRRIKAFQCHGSIELKKRFPLDKYGEHDRHED